jgi:hypothetical protein
MSDYWTSTRGCRTDSTGRRPAPALCLPPQRRSARGCRDPPKPASRKRLTSRQAQTYLFPDPRSVASIDRQKEGYFLFQSQEGGVDEPSVLRELSEKDERVWSITSILYKHKLTYAVDGEIRLTWREFPHGDRPTAHDPIDEDLLFVEDACREAGIRFSLAALMAVVDIGSGVRMDINWPHAPSPAVIIDDPVW